MNAPVWCPYDRLCAGQVPPVGLVVEEILNFTQRWDQPQHIWDDVWLILSETMYDHACAIHIPEGYVDSVFSMVAQAYGLNPRTFTS